MAPQPIRLRPDNFTPPARTPWGGTRLMRLFKVGLGIDSVAPDAVIGESWELSVCSEFHSVTETGEPLGQALAREPQAMLGDEARSGRALTALLLKWLDAGDDLSLQIHPEDDYAGLGPEESGKLEAWYIVDHAEGAGLYLGFESGVTQARVSEALANNADLSALMRFVPVQRGDFVVLDPGTPHAVGKGVTLIEPQLVEPGRRGVTYRYWDWNRRYAPNGGQDPSGRPRELHAAHALAVTRWERATDPTWLATRRAALGWPAAEAPAKVELLCGPEPENAVLCPRLHAARLFGTGNVRLPDWNALRSLTVVEGEVVLGAGAEALRVARGCTVAVPAAAHALAVELQAAHVFLSAAVG